jgi:hypothetical protein
MSTDHEPNKAAIRRLDGATNTGDPQLISNTIDELLSDALIRTPLPIEATRAQAMKDVVARLHRVFPDLHITVEDLMRMGTRSSAATRLPGPTGASTWATPPPANPSPTTTSSSYASRAAESLRPGGWSTSSRR